MHQLRRRAPQGLLLLGRRARARLPVRVRPRVQIGRREIFLGRVEPAQHVGVMGPRGSVRVAPPERAVRVMRHLRGVPVGERMAAVLLAAGMEVRTQRSHPPAAAFEPKLVAVRTVDQRKAERLLHRVRPAPLVGAQREDLAPLQSVQPLPALRIYQPDLHRQPPLTSSSSCSGGAPGPPPARTAPAASPRAPVSATPPRDRALSPWLNS